MFSTHDLIIKWWICILTVFWNDIMFSIFVFLDIQSKQYKNMIWGSLERRMHTLQLTHEGDVCGAFVSENLNSVLPSFFFSHGVSSRPVWIQKRHISSTGYVEIRGSLDRLISIHLQLVIRHLYLMTSWHGEIHCSPVEFLTRGQRFRPLLFYLLLAWISCWTNICGASDWSCDTTESI